MQWTRLGPIKREKVIRVRAEVCRCDGKNVIAFAKAATVKYNLHGFDTAIIYYHEVEKKARIVFLEDATGDFRLLKKQTGSWVGTVIFANDLIRHLSIKPGYYPFTAPEKNVFEIDFTTDVKTPWVEPFIASS